MLSQRYLWDTYQEKLTLFQETDYSREERKRTVTEEQLQLRHVLELILFFSSFFLLILDIIYAHYRTLTSKQQREF